MLLESVHQPVLLKKVIKLLSIKSNGTYVDGTAGFGGHSQEILKKLRSAGKLVMIDQDPDALEALSKRFKNNKNVVLSLDNFVNIKDILISHKIFSVNGVLFDIGVSSFQLNNFCRGFSYRAEDAALDMRMSKVGKSAKDIINSYSEKDLKKIIFEFSEEKFAPQIARAIVNKRKQNEINTSRELVEIIKSALPAKVLRNSSVHPARKTFQSIRIEVNNELEALKNGLECAFEILKPGGVLCVISFHSLEDRIVKKKFKKFSSGCVCPPDFPVCICNKKPKGILLAKKPIKPDEEEILRNPRSRSAKLRAIQKIHTSQNFT